MKRAIAMEKVWLGDHYGFGNQLKRHIERRSLSALAAGDQARDAIETRDQLADRQKKIRDTFMASIGNLPNDAPSLNARIVGKVPGTGYQVEKIIFESRPDAFVTGNLYLPDRLSGPTAAVLFLCGHSKQAKLEEEYQYVCQKIVHQGLVVLSIDPIGQGERLSYYEPEIGDSTIGWGVPEHDYAGNQCLPLGDSLARYFLHDAMRAVDYLSSRPEVDAAKIGVTGCSGGGTQTCLMMLGDPRIAAAAPATFLMNRESFLLWGAVQDAEQIWPGWTADGMDHEDILIAMAPKPVMVLAVKYDFFPIEGTRRTVRRTERFWEMHGRSDRLRLYEDASTHRYTEKLAEAAAQFFAQHLLACPPAAPRIQPCAHEPAALQCTRSGQIRGDYPHARAVTEFNRERLLELERRRLSLPVHERLERARKWLFAAVHRSRKVCELNPRRFPAGHLEDIWVEGAVWRSQEDLFSHALMFKHLRLRHERLPVTLALWDAGTQNLQPHTDWIRETCSAGRHVIVLDPSAVGIAEPEPLSPGSDPCLFYEVMHQMANNLLWLNDSLAALRTYDVIRALDFIRTMEDVSPEPVFLYGSGRHSLYGQLAAALDSRIGEVSVHRNLRSFTELVSARHYNSHDIMSLLLPGILQYCDLPELADMRLI